MGTRRRTPLIAAALIALAATGGCGSDDPVEVPAVEGAPSAGGTAAPGGPAADRVVRGAPSSAAASARGLPVEARWLDGVDTAFDGEVTDVADGTVTFSPDRWWTGDPAGEVVLEDASALAGLLGGVPAFEVGQRWLVAASAGRVAVCGFTAPWSGELEAVYAEAFS